mgnify:CR=1 FL=1
MRDTKLTRRAAMKSTALATAAVGLSPLLARQARASAEDAKLLFIVAAGGGASLLDSFLPVLSTEGSGGNTFTAAQIDQPAGSNLRCVKPMENSIQGAIALGNNFPQSTFLSKHKADVAVLTSEVTSVNHLVAAKRAMTGNDVNRGRTLGEAMALRHGDGMLLPNVNMSGAGYLEAGKDAVPDWTRAEPVSDPLLFPFSTHGSRGIAGAPSSSAIARARETRKSLEEVSPFAHTFANAPLLQRFVARRDTITQDMEAASLITKLMMLQSGQANLSAYDLETSPLGQTILQKLPNVAVDPFEAQAALAFLLTRFGVSCTVTLGPSNSPVFESTERIINAPIAFDWSHNDHRGGQNAMWSRILKVMDALIDLLKATDHLGNAGLGKMWDRSLIYVATEFGRDKVSSGGSGHHLNNGNVLVSPLIKGNRVYGGVNPNTCLTYGFDPTTGDPLTGEVMREQHIYSAIAHAMDIDFDTRIDMPGVVKNA